MKRASDPDALRAAVAERRLSHRQLAGIVGCSHGTIRFILDGRATSDDNARRLARALDRHLNTLFEPVPSTPERTNDHGEAVA